LSFELMQLNKPNKPKKLKRPMERKRRFEPGEMVRALTGQCGMVVSPGEFTDISKRLKEGRKPGHHFAAGCCHNPDYIAQVPVLFEDGTWDVMRAMNIRKAPDLPEEKKARILALSTPAER
jgi:hypothetical protein